MEKEEDKGEDDDDDDDDDNNDDARTGDSQSHGPRHRVSGQF